MNYLIKNAQNELSNLVYIDYATIEDDNNFPIIIKQGKYDYLVEDSMQSTSYNFNKDTIEKLENNAKYEEEEIFNLLVTVYRAYENYNSCIKAEQESAKINHTVTEYDNNDIIKGDINQDNIIDILSELMERFDYARISRMLQSKTDKEIVNIFYLSGLEGQEAVQQIIEEIEDEYGFTYEKSLWN